MLILASILVAAGLVLAAIAIRGRVVARGRFCRGCKFDLAGLGNSETCPECGRDVTLPNATRPARRRNRWAMLIAAVLLTVSGTGMAAATQFPRGLAFYDKLPNWAIIHLDWLGVDEARTVISYRSQDPKTFSESQWQTLLRRGLAHQADPTVPWDPRWGDVLGRGFIAERMTKAQMAAYIGRAFVADVQIRDRATVDHRWIGYAAQFDHGRVHMSTGLVGSGPANAMQTPYVLRHRVVRAGLADLHEPDRTGNAGYRGRLQIPWSGAGGDLGGVSHVIPMRGVNSDNPPEHVLAFVETQIEIDDAASGSNVLTLEPVRHEQRVRLLPTGSAIVGIVRDNISARTIADTAGVGPLLVHPVEASEDEAARSEVHCELRIGSPMHAIAGRLYAVSADGREAEIGSFSARPDGVLVRGMGRAFWNEPHDPEEMDRYARSLDWLDRGLIDLVFRTDPAEALDDATVDEIVEITLWFRNIPVERRQAGSGLRQPPERFYPADRGSIREASDLEE
jgi:hypothetical protein